MHFLKFLLVLTLSLGFSLGTKAADPCVPLYARLSQTQALEGTDEVVARFTPTKRYPHGFEGQDGKHFMFGFESEFTLNEIDGILNLYRPADEIMPKEQWLAMSVQDRKDYVKNNVKTLFPSTRKEGKFILFSESPEHAFLPKHMITDDTGNMELVLSPVNTYEEWFKNVSVVNRDMGVGSMQATVSLPKESFFKNVSEKTKTESLPWYREWFQKAKKEPLPVNPVDSTLGYTKFYAELDVMEKLVNGHQRYLADRNELVTKSFNHPYLGPFTAQREARLKAALEKEASGTPISEGSRRVWGKYDSSPKFFGGTTYRPDIASEMGRATMEIRDAHKNFDLLNQRLQRSIYHLSHDRAEFMPAAQIPAFDHTAEFEKFSAPVKKMLEDLFPNRAIPGEVYDEANREAVNVFKNFAYPLREWEPILTMIGAAPEMRATVTMARGDYKTAINGIQDQYERGLFTLNSTLVGDDLAREVAALKRATAAKIQGKLAKFAHDSQIYLAMKNYETNLVYARSPDAGFDNLVREMGANAGVFARHFPERVMVGSLEARVEHFRSLYPDRVKIMKDLKLTGGSERYAIRGGTKDIMMVSLHGLSRQEIAELNKNYIKIFSEGLVAFPLGENAGHLYTRAGNSTFDFFSRVATNPFDLNQISSDKLENLFLLNPTEQKNLHQYFVNAEADSHKVLGSFSYTGEKASRVPGSTIEKNASPSGHNCTSWVCTAPIGEDGKSIQQLVGAGNIEVGSNPGWWGSWLGASTRATDDSGNFKARSPMAVYFTKDPLNQAIATRTNGTKNFKWDFGAH
jgi:hypothetical protein